MLRRTKKVLFGGVLLEALSHCSGGGGGTLGPTPATLVSTCDKICANVVATCTESVSLDATCMAACGDLNLVQLGCIDPFAAYLACIAGATSVQCGAGGQDVLITTPECESDRQAAITCNAPPGAVAVCIELPDNSACGVSAPGSVSAMFCVGAPSGCSLPPSSSPNPVGIGTYCCP
jgi:hypothetical protein